MKATERQTGVVISLIDAHTQTTKTYIPFQHRILLTAKQHRTLTEGWSEGMLPWGNRIATTKGVVDWRLFPGPLGYFLEYGVGKAAPVVVYKEKPVRGEKAKILSSPGLPVSVKVERTPTFVKENDRIHGEVKFAEGEQAKAKTIITGEVWQVYRGKKWVKLDRPVKMTAYCTHEDHSARVLVEWKKLKVTNIASRIVEEPVVPVSPIISEQSPLIAA